MMDTVDTEKIDFALKHGTKTQRKNLLNWIYDLNEMAEAIWLEQNNEESTSKLMKKATKALKSWSQPTAIEEPLINVQGLCLICPFCSEIITPKLKKSRKGAVRWNVNKFKRHLKRKHRKAKSARESSKPPKKAKAAVKKSYASYKALKK